VEWYYVCWPRLTAKRVEPVVSIRWACICLLAGLRRNCSSDFQKIRWNVAHGLWKKLLDFDCRLDHVTLWVRLRLRSGDGTAILRVGRYVLPVFENTYSFFFQNSKCFVAYVFSNNHRQCLLHLEVYQIASLHCALWNIIYIQHYIKLLIKIWP